MTLTFESYASPWWPYLFILLAGALATHVWRWIGAVAGGILSEQSAALLWVNAVATALVAAVVGQLIVFPTGDLAATPLLLRLAAAGAGWLGFLVARRSVFAGIATGELVLLAGWATLW